MKVVPSTYHQCLKFPHEGTKITIAGDPDPFQYCNNMRGTTQFQVPINQEASSSRYIDPSSLTRSSTPFSMPSNPKVQVHDMGCGEYRIDNLQVNENANATEKDQNSNNDVKTTTKRTQKDDHAWIETFWYPDDTSTSALSASAQTFHIHDNPMFGQDIYDNPLFDHDPAEDIQSSSFHPTYPGLGYASSIVTSTKPPFQVIKDVQTSFDVSNSKKDSPKDFIDGIATPVHPLNIPVTFPTSSISLMSIRIIEMDQQVIAQEKNKGKDLMNGLSLKGDKNQKIYCKEKKIKTSPLAKIKRYWKNKK